MKSLRAKILISFFMVIIFSVIMALYNNYSISKVNQETEEIITKEVPLLITDEKLALNISQRISLARGYVLYGDEAYKEDFLRYTEDSQRIQNDLLKISESEEVKSLIDKSIEWRKMIIDEVFAAYDSGQQDLAAQLLAEQAQPLAREIMGGFEEMALSREAHTIELGNNIIKQGKNIYLSATILSIIAVVIGIVIAMRTANQLTNPIVKVMNRLQEIGKGNLDNEPIHHTDNTEIGSLIHSTNEMNAQLKDLVMKMSSVSTTVAEHSHDLTQSSNEVKEATTQVATTMEELATGTETQASTASDLAEGMKQFYQEIMETNEAGDYVSEASQQVLSMTKNGRKLMDKSVHQMSVIDEIVKEAVEKVKGLDNQSKEVSKLVQVIKDIADQTNLLALNAAIEAARAGEHGKGFAVVAEEVRKLAEQVSHSVVDITNIVDSIQQESNGVASSLQHSYAQVEEGTNQIKVTGETFADIQHAVTDTNERTEKISATLRILAQQSKDMNMSIENIASISQQSAAGVEQTSASMEETNSSMEQITASADSLSNLADQLNTLIGRFHLSKR
ncbi:methyl-accepting chemotaxis protein [Bacillus tianshenii]|nr:methyl-accepting chemotaxis protein [Bacillus tianshenii]